MRKRRLLCSTKDGLFATETAIAGNVRPAASPPPRAPTSATAAPRCRSSSAYAAAVEAVRRRRARGAAECATSSAARQAPQTAARRSRARGVRTGGKAGRAAVSALVSRDLRREDSAPAPASRPSSSVRESRCTRPRPSRAARGAMEEGGWEVVQPQAPKRGFFPRRGAFRGGRGAGTGTLRSRSQFDGAGGAPQGDGDAYGNAARWRGAGADARGYGPALSPGAPDDEAGAASSSSPATSPAGGACAARRQRVSSAGTRVLLPGELTSARANRVPEPRALPSLRCALPRRCRRGVPALAMGKSGRR